MPDNTHRQGPFRVALRKESVDRNSASHFKPYSVRESLSARRAWIEINDTSGATGRIFRSLSARRAWIEIFEQEEEKAYLDVALRKESVDRNKIWYCGTSIGLTCRSPQGERG